MKRNLFLSLAVLAISIPSFAFSTASPCNDAGHQATMQKKTRMHKVKPRKQKKDDQMQDVTGFNG